MEGHAKGGPISRLPLITISDPSHQLRDFPVCQVLYMICISVYYYDIVLRFCANPRITPPAFPIGAELF